jgi:hypothetical protein
VPAAPDTPPRPPADQEPAVVRSELTLRALIQALADPGLRRRAIDELAQAGASAVPLLIEALSAKEDAVQSGAGEALARIGVALGTLRLRIRPWAEVTVDGKPAGTTPLRALRLPAGEHTVGLRHPGYAPVDRRVVVRPGLTTELHVDLQTEAEPAAPR